MIKNAIKNEKAYVVVALTDRYDYKPFVLTQSEENELRKSEKVIISIECDDAEKARELFWYAHEKCKELNKTVRQFRKAMLYKIGLFTDPRVNELRVAVVEHELENEAPLTAGEVYELANAMFGYDGDEIASKYLK